MQKYFDEFKFTDFKNKEIKIIEVNFQGRDNDGRTNYKISQIFPERTKKPYVKNLLQILPDFERILDQISQDICEELDMEGRELLFLDIDDLKPKTSEETKQYIERYGKYMKNGGRGLCRRLKEGNFMLEIGISKYGTQKDFILETMAHEYGHSLGTHLESVIFEELKAFAFVSLFRRFYDSTWSTCEKYSLFGDRPHDVARHRLNELLRAGIREEAIISHLIMKRFGRFNPEDYLKFIK